MTTWRQADLAQSLLEAAQEAVVKREKASFLAGGVEKFCEACLSAATCHFWTPVSVVSLLGVGRSALAALLLKHAEVLVLCAWHLVQCLA